MDHEHTITIRLSDEAERSLCDRVGSSPAAMSQFVEAVVERELSTKRPSFDELAAPFRTLFDATGMNAQQLSSLIDAARTEVHAEKSGAAG